MSGHEILTAPFPYFGGKRKWIHEVWSRFGNPDIYLEPFAGSCAILLGRQEPCRREVISDKNGFVCNFWRAVRDDPEAVAYYADWPTVHQDLTSRHRWLLHWGRTYREQLSEDPDWYDAKAAGWWVWGASLWIGHGWCQDRDGAIAERDTGIDRQPTVMPSNAGRGISAQVKDQMPYLSLHPGGAGVSAQNGKPDKIPYVSDTSGVGVSRQSQHPDKIPYVGIKVGARGVSPEAEKRPRIFAKATGGVGVCRQRDNVPWEVVPRIGSEIGGQGVSRQRARSQRLIPWFMALADRLHAVIVLNRSWQSCLTPTVMSDTPSSPKVNRAIFLDPPYLIENRHSRIYATDWQDLESQAARESWKWALEHGSRPDFRIAYCCQEGEFYFPPDWECITSTMSGIKRPDRKHRREAVYFSPGCQTVQGNLF